MREWRRLYRSRGIAPFGAILVVLLAALVAVDRVADHWDAVVRKRDDLQRRIDLMRTKVDRAPRIDAALETSRTRVSAVSARIITAADAGAAGNLLARSAGDWLGTLGAKSPEAVKAEAVARAAAGVAAAEVSVRMTPAQLLRVLHEWPQAPLAMRLVRLEVNVDNADAPTALKTKLHVQAVFQPSPSEAATRTRTPAPRPGGESAR